MPQEKQEIRSPVQKTTRAGFPVVESRWNPPVSAGVGEHLRAGAKRVGHAVLHARPGTSSVLQRFFLDAGVLCLVHIRKSVSVCEASSFSARGSRVGFISHGILAKEADYLIAYHQGVQRAAEVVCFGNSASCLTAKGLSRYAKEGGILKPQVALGRHELVLCKTKSAIGCSY